MPPIDVSTLTQAIDEASPTGPDLDYDGDLDYMNFVARIEGQFPSSYFDFVADKSKYGFDFDKDSETISGLLSRSRDVRLLVMLARLQLLHRQFDGFRATFGAITDLLEARWDEVHPRAEGGDFTFRSIALQMLEDPPTVLLPLAHVVIGASRRAGPVTYRVVQLSVGKASPRTNEAGDLVEDVLDPGAVERLFLEVPPEELRSHRTVFDDIRSAARRIAKLTGERAGGQNVTFSKLIELLSEIVAYLDVVLVKLDPSAASEAGASENEAGADQAGPSAGGGAGIKGKVASQADVVNALAAARKYFVAREPSSPCLLLLRQAESLVGKSFADVLRVLEPSFAEQAMFVIGATDRFSIPLERLAAVEAPETDGTSEEEEAGSAWDEAAPEEEVAAETWDETGDPDTAAGEESDLPDDSEASSAGDDGSEQPEEVVEEPVVQRPVAAAANPKPSFSATTRVEALEIIAQVESFYRTAEPSSPIPYLLARLRDLANRDFLSVLRELLPASLLRPESE